MRLWSLHPRELDRQGLLAVWREGLLARKVLAGETRGYRNHPQLRRFREHSSPPGAIAAYLHAVADEAERRGYRFDRTRIGSPERTAAPIPVTTGQLRFEARHLAAKLSERIPETLAGQPAAPRPWPHPLFRVRPGPVADWERAGAAHAPPPRTP
ncbi:MAG: pyrimidine dimer DNA glycosylase/endonuclease V [Acidobacteriota bacterium]|nr:pyrimidine dimer DNA glycosylase/endonuclease V [Acidobacteriota bacterium]